MSSQSEKKALTLNDLKGKGFGEEGKTLVGLIETGQVSSGWWLAKAWTLHAGQDPIQAAYDYRKMARSGLEKWILFLSFLPLFLITLAAPFFISRIHEGSLWDLVLGGLIGLSVVIVFFGNSKALSFQKKRSQVLQPANDFIHWAKSLWRIMRVEYAFPQPYDETKLRDLIRCQLNDLAFSVLFFEKIEKGLSESLRTLDSGRTVGEIVEERREDFRRLHEMANLLDLAEKSQKSYYDSAQQKLGSMTLSATSEKGLPEERS